MSPDDPDPYLPTSGHLLVTYEGETPPWPSVPAFLTAGLDGDRRLVYLHDRSEPGEVEEQLRRTGLDVARLVASGQLHFLDAGEHDPDGGEIEPTHVVQSLRTGLVDAVRDGFDSLQVVGEAGWISGRVDPETLVEFERRADEVLGRETVDILCLYPSAQWNDSVLGALKEAHEKHLHRPAYDGGRATRQD